MNELLERINEKEMELASTKFDLLQLKNQKKIAESGLLIKDKDFWKEKEITNAEGRKAYVALAVSDEAQFICNKQGAIIRLEAELECLKREWELRLIEKQQ
ncbi:MAG: hypothetical protein HUJ68_02905 [Clostridia bacterium]|nr:hypothetical protein [Clostridia bacterium]